MNIKVSVPIPEPPYTPADTQNLGRIASVQIVPHTASWSADFAKVFLRIFQDHKFLQLMVMLFSDTDSFYITSVWFKI